jgi:hypothetical protein
MDYYVDENDFNTRVTAISFRFMQVLESTGKEFEE